MHFRVLLSTRTQADDTIPGSALPLELQWEYRQWLQKYADLQGGEEMKALEDAPSGNRVSKPSRKQLAPDENCSAAARKAASRVKMHHAPPEPQRATYISGSLPPTRPRDVPQGTKIKKVRPLKCAATRSLPAICDRPEKVVRYDDGPSTCRDSDTRSCEDLADTLREDQELYQHALRLTRLTRTEPRRPRWEATDSPRVPTQRFDAHHCPRRVRNLIGKLRDLRGQMHDITSSFEHVLLEEKFIQDQYSATDNIGHGLRKMYMRAKQKSTADVAFSPDISEEDRQQPRPNPLATVKKQGRNIMQAMRFSTNLPRSTLFSV